MVQGAGASSSNTQPKEKVTRRALQFIEEMDSFSLTKNSCVDLLRAMELDEIEEDPIQEETQIEDEDGCLLPIEWVDIVKAQKSNSQHDVDMFPGSDGELLNLGSMQMEGEDTQSTQPTTDDLVKMAVDGSYHLS